VLLAVIFSAVTAWMLFWWVIALSLRSVVRLLERHRTRRGD
jgi:high-affinity Fe2+/Pb2+ permease